MQRRDGRAAHRAAHRAVTPDPQSAVLPPGGIAFDAAGTLAIGAGQTLMQSGIISSAVTLGAGAALTEAAGGWLSVFGNISGPGAGAGAAAGSVIGAPAGTLAIAANATLYAAGAIDASVVACFGGAGGTLQLAALDLSQMQGALAGFGAGDALDIVSGTITDAVLAVGSGGGSLTLRDDGATVATLALADVTAAGCVAFAVPDAIDGTRILLGPAMPSVVSPAPAGSPGGNAFVWNGGGSGRWSDATAWTGGVGIAPGRADGVTVAGGQASVLALAGDGDAASLEVTGLVALAGRFDVGALVVGAGASDALLLTAGSAVAAGSATLVAGTLQVAASGAVLQATGTTTLGGGTLWVADGGLVETPDLALTGATIRVDSGGAVAVGGLPGPGGSIGIAAAGRVAGYGSLREPVVNDGVLTASGGVLAIYGSVSGAGLMQVASGGELYLPYGVASGQQIAFNAGPGQGGSGQGGSGQGGSGQGALGEQGDTLELFGSAAGCAATITGFGVGDAIDIASCTLTRAAWTPPASGSGIGVLDLGAQGTLDIALAAGLDPGLAQFSVAADGLGGSRISVVPCFCRGTRLRTPAGEVAVEALAIGDRVLTASGAARRVRWIGRRRCAAAMLRGERQLRPIRIRAGALGAGAPLRDLLLSPQHALALPTLLGLRLVPAVALVDGGRIVVEDPCSDVTYFHVELDSHDLLLAEGVAAESFLADGAERRALFQTALGSPAPANEACCPRLEQGEALEAVRQALGLQPAPGRTQRTTFARASLDVAELSARGLRLEGWAIDAALPSRAVRLEILADGSVVGRVVANLWRPDLARAGLRDGNCAFEATLPGIRTGHVRSVSVRSD